jgi:hypothetical protein
MARPVLRRQIVAIVAALLCAGASGSLQAGFIPVLVTHPGNTFNYEIDFTTNTVPNETLVSGDFVTLYDLGAAISGPATNPAGITVPANFTVTTQLLGLDPAGGLVNPTDNPGLMNVTFTYNGPTLTVDSTFFSTITAPAQYTAVAASQYTGTNAIPAGKNTQIGPVLVPAVPEPGTGAMLLIGALSFLRRKR